jgi:hypothetical protein
MKMDKTNYEQQAKDLLAEMREIIEVKGLDLSLALEDAGMDGKTADQFFSGDKLPNLQEFLALCEISGLTFTLPSVETPKNPM